MFIRIDNGIAVEFFETNPEFHPDVPIIEFNGEVELGWEWTGDAFVSPSFTIPLDVKLRMKRDQQLGESDWIAIRAAETGVPMSEEWATFRQALRDIPSQEGFPDNVEWPVHPLYSDIE